jgi:hypothetical protein
LLLSCILYSASGFFCCVLLHVAMTCCHVMSSYHVVISCRHVMLSCHVVMSSCHVVMSCCHFKLSCHVVSSLVVLCFHVIMSGCHTLWSCDGVMGTRGGPVKVLMEPTPSRPNSRWVLGVHRVNFVFLYSGDYVFCGVSCPQGVDSGAE